jgi:hypothetical protein
MLWSGVSGLLLISGARNTGVEAIVSICLLGHCGQADRPGNFYSTWRASSSLSSPTYPSWSNLLRFYVLSYDHDTQKRTGKISGTFRCDSKPLQFANQLNVARGSKTSRWQLPRLTVVNQIFASSRRAYRYHNSGAPCETQPATSFYYAVSDAARLIERNEYL